MPQTEHSAWALRYLEAVRIPGSPLLKAVGGLLALACCAGLVFIGTLAYVWAGTALGHNVSGFDSGDPHWPYNVLFTSVIGMLLSGFLGAALLAAYAVRHARQVHAPSTP